MQKNAEFVGVIPMAGKAARLPGIPFSKEMMPFGTIPEKAIDSRRIQVISEILVQRMKAAGIEKLHMIIRKGKWDIPNYFGGGIHFGTDICYHIADNETAVPFTIDQAFPFLGKKNIVLGFPDIYFQPEDAFVRLINRLENEYEADLVLGLIPVKNPQKWDMVLLNPDESLNDIHIKKPSQLGDAYAWIIAAWRPQFSEFLRQWLQTNERSNEGLSEEIQLSNVILDFKNEGYNVKCEIFSKGEGIDCGTIDGWTKALARFSGLTSHQ